MSPSDKSKTKREESVVPGDNHNDTITTGHVGPGAVTGNVEIDAKKTVDHTRELNDNDGTVNISDKHAPK